MFVYVIKERGEEVISERHQKDFKPEGSKLVAKNATEDFTDIKFEDI
tara:strand:- start:81 stop:221 length:141 start_codon:yes stop_codon:yes gene_type:complete